MYMGGIAVQMWFQDLGQLSGPLHYSPRRIQPSQSDKILSSPPLCRLHALARRGRYIKYQQTCTVMNQCNMASVPTIRVVTDWRGVSEMMDQLKNYTLIGIDTEHIDKWDSEYAPINSSLT